MKKALKDLLGSKKFLVTLAAIIVWVGGKAGLGLSTEMVLPIVTLLGVFVGGQAVADLGKEKAKVASDAITKASAAITDITDM